MKKILSFLIFALLAISASAMGETFTSGKLSYTVTYYGTNETYPGVVVNGFIPNLLGSASKELEIPSTVTYNGSTYSVVEIAEGAFEERPFLETVSIDYGMYRVNANAFKGCTALTTVRLPSSVNKIGDNAFANCSALTTVSIAVPDPTSGTYSTTAFPSNAGMTLNVPKTNLDAPQLYQGMAAFSKFANVACSSEAYDFRFSDNGLFCVTKAPTKISVLPGEITMVGYKQIGISFSSAGSFEPLCGSGYYTKAGYKYKFTAISKNACWANYELTSLDLSALQYLKVIGEEAFYYCRNLSSINFPTNSLEEIYVENRAISSLGAISEIFVPKNIRFYEDFPPFHSCSMKRINVAEDSELYSSFEGCLYDKDKTTLLRCPGGYEGRTIGGNTGVLDVFPSTLTKIGFAAVTNCSNITQVKLPYGVTAISQNAFIGCTSLQSVKLPSSTKYISSRAFEGCDALSEVFIAVPDPSKGNYSDRAFPNNADLKFYVPKTNSEVIEAYRAHEAFSRFSTSDKMERSSKANDFEHEDGGMFCVTKAATDTEPGEVSMVGFQPTAQVTDGAFVPACGEGFYTFSGKNYKLTEISYYACYQNWNIRTANLAALKYLSAIKKWAFNFSTLTSIQLPTTSYNENPKITLEDWSFCMTEFETVNITKYVYVSSAAFAESNLNWFNVDEENLWHSAYEGILFDKNLTALICCPTYYNADVIDFLPYTMKSIEYNAFNNCERIKKIKIPYGTKTIGEEAFLYCRNLISASIPSSVENIEINAFDTNSLKELYIAAPSPLPGFKGIMTERIDATLYVPKTNPDAVEQYQAFEPWSNYFSSIEQSSKANDFEHEDGGMFCVVKNQDGYNLGKVTMVGFQPTDQVTDGAFVPACGEGLYTFGENSYKFTSICDHACDNNKEIKSVDLSALKYLFTIGTYAFHKATNLASIQLPITSINRPNDILIKDIALAWTKIEQIVLTKNVKITSEAFESCPLKWIDAVDDHLWYSSDEGILYDKEKTTLITVPSKYETEVIDFLPYTLKTIGDYAFAYTGVTKVRIPYGTTNIGTWAFAGCSKLNTLNLPSSVMAIGANALESCYADIYLAAPEPLQGFDENAFPDSNRAKLFVSKHSNTSNYRTHESTKYFSSIEQSSKANDFEHEDGGMFCVLNPATETQPGEVTMVGFQPTDQVTDGAFVPACGDGLYTLGGKDYKFIDICEDACEENLELKSIDLSNLHDLRFINGGAFNKSGLSHVALPNNAPVVTQITGTAFDYTSITSLALTKSIKMRAYPMFGHCNQLEWIDVDESNSYHSSFQGMLFDKEQTLLMACPKAYRGQENGNTDKLINQFPSTIVNIESYAFSNCSGIERVELPYGLESLFGSAFNNCNALQAIKIPSSVQRIYGSVFSDCSSLREVAMAATTPANFSNPYSAFPNNAHMTLYVPKTNPNAVEEYRAHEAFANFETIERHSKANDFEHEDGGMFCVLTPASETEPGEVAMVGFQPTEQVTDGAFAPACGEGYYTFGGKNYNFTAISNDACYANTHLLSFDFSQLNKLTSIGEKAFAECRNLNELLIGHNEECSFGANFYGNNSQDFKCFVRWTDYRKFKNMVNTWSMLEGETKHPVEHLNSYVQVDEDKELCAFSVGHPVDWNASGLDAYAITSYNRSEEMGTASPVSYSPAGIGLIIEGLEGDVVYKLERPTGNTSVPQNFLVGTADGEADAFTKTVGYVFNESRKCFTRPTASTIVPEGSAYLRISNTLAGNTTKITIDLWPESGLLGDVNGDGNVDVTDVTCLINKVLGSAAYPDDVCDINGNGIIDVSDISDLILLVIG